MQSQSRGGLCGDHPACKFVQFTTLRGGCGSWRESLCNNRFADLGFFVCALFYFSVVVNLDLFLLVVFSYYSCSLANKVHYRRD